jgi:hypothetical protein
LYARSIGYNGVEGLASTAIFLRIDSKAFSRNYLWLDVADDRGPVAEDGITNQTKLTIRGVATPGSVVTLFDDRDNDGVLDEGERLTTYLANGTTLLAQVVANATTGLFAADVIVGVGEYSIRAMQTLNGFSRLVGESRNPA